MAIAKVILNGETQMDVTQKTVTAETLLSGVTALKNDGTSITGVLSNPAIGIEDTPDSAGGTVRTIMAVSLAGDTVTAEHLESGYTAHDATGSAITGALSPGGTSSYTLLKSSEETVQTSSTTKATISTIQFQQGELTNSKILYIRVRDKAGRQNGYFYGTDTWYFFPGDGSSSPLKVAMTIMTDSNGTKTARTGAFGVYPDGLNTDGTILTMYSVYNSMVGAVDSTYKIEIYVLDWPDNVSPFT